MRTTGSAPPTRCCATRSTAEPDDAPERSRPAPGCWAACLSNRDFAILIVAIAVFIFFAVMGQRFLSEFTMIDIARRASILGILAVGMTFLFVAGELDLSIGSHYGFLLILMSYQNEGLAIDPLSPHSW